jgi:DNA sulfur modification protein DndC
MSVFADGGFRVVVEDLHQEIRDLYARDAVPWVVGYSGGKDSTAVLQLIWQALAGLPEPDRQKPVHVISTDTLVENPVVAAWVNRSLVTMREAAAVQRMPIRSHRLTPDPENTFWTNLIGKGYPAPRPKFRWCTERLKINPSNSFIRRVVQESGEALLVLGTRKAESAARARSMEGQERRRKEARLSPNASLPNSLVYTPVEDWANDDVWLYLMQETNPWGWENRDLLTMYQGASEDGECPLVVDTTTPSCGSSRFGCWTCTLVEQDKSMQAMIRNDQDKEWMQPLLDLRNKLGVQDDRSRRDFRRMSGVVQLYYRKSDDADQEARVIPGPYTQAVREELLRDVLHAQQLVRARGPEDFRDLELITVAELEEIRRLWVVEKHEFEDSLPRIYEEETGRPYPGKGLMTGHTFGAAEIEILREVCGGETLQFELIRELLDTEVQFRAMARRRGLFGALEGAFKKHFYRDEEDAHTRAVALKNARESAEDGHYQPVFESASTQRGGL